MKVALYFGSFNPIHLGHLSIARSVVDQSLADEVWFIVSPLSPFKQNDELLPENSRFLIVEEAIKNRKNFKALDIEFYLPKPSYTYQTLKVLKNDYADIEFILLIGSDNLENFHLWKNYKDILSSYSIVVYPRNKSVCKNVYISDDKYQILDVPLLPISSTDIRERIKNKQDFSELVDKNTYKIISNKGFYSY